MAAKKGKQRRAKLLYFHLQQVGNLFKLCVSVFLYVFVSVCVCVCVHDCVSVNYKCYVTKEIVLN